ncbi:exodeoxyribonuclease V subunit gamma [Candidatus Blochmannia ocreatus (nom. nud.)]|uniref:RecBCD enzyme subunit RecC n=1 Tax=Candidatus Blochmannia ocreatus (nom. nud.) TaxID=251538 RepID=A0ABY4SZF4_9ENTR|nr:exodeoxyribonuclease V subunit gamma [Candidatus Blochmannia ocreatus]URJ25332.1 exodeoxyribonuclease V subunit gamma [Candidatus Blochmannia ocreatus]
MLTIYHSNNAKKIKNLLIDIISNKPLSDPMTPEIILVEKSIKREWLKIELANHFGILCNTEFDSIPNFIQKIYKTISSHNYIEKSNFSYSVMYWKFMEILNQNSIIKNYSTIQTYLKNDINQRKIGQLSEQLAYLFTQYLIYRPDWLNFWKNNHTIKYIKNDHQIWQAEIWKNFLKNTNLYNKDSLTNIEKIYITPLQHCIYLLKHNYKKYNIPKRIFIFGLTTIPIVYWKIIKLLSSHTNIYLWFINPSNCNIHNNSHVLKKNTYSIKQLSSKRKNTITSHQSKYSFYEKYNKTTNTFSNTDNIFLYSWNNIGRNTLSLFKEFKNKIEFNYFYIPKKKTLLFYVKKGISNFYKNKIHIKYLNTNKILKNKQKNIFLPGDKSISFHICYNLQREIEILHDNLLSLITNDPSLSPGDILVLAPNISKYVTIINTVFNTKQKNQYLPFSISCKYKNNIHPIILTFLSILNLPHSRCTSEEILSFLKVPSVSKKFNITIEEIKLLNIWIIDSNIRWGLDNITMNKFNLPITNQHTWQFGLNRMLLSYALKNSSKTWMKIFPYSNIENREHFNLIGKLGQFLQTLKKWRDQLEQSYEIKQWTLYFKEIINDFFHQDPANTEENKALQFLITFCQEILQSGIQANYNQKINVLILKDKLSYKLNQKKTIYKFVPNTINFCDLAAAYCIPYKIIYILGMNDNFPRKKISPNFNLMAKKPRKHDKNTYEQDCYTFLLTLLSAQEKIYISFIGNNMQNNTVCFPSRLVNELFEYIAENFYFKKDENIEINIKIKRIRQHLCQQHSLFAFSPENFLPNTDTQSFSNEWLPAATVINMTPNLKKKYSHFNVPIIHFSTKTINFQDLYNFYYHPVQWWFQKRLNIYFNKNIVKIIDPYHVEINNFNRYKLNIKLIHYLINNKNTKQLYQNIYASGILPYGAFGKLFWEKQYAKMLKLAHQIHKYYVNKQNNLNISIKLNEIKLTGQLTRVQENGLIRWTPKNISMRDVFLLWLEHITYCAIGGKGDSRLIGINDTWHFPNFSKTQAKKILSTLILGYSNGINTPILLLYQSGGSWINHIFNKVTKSISSDPLVQQEARKKLIYTWQHGTNQFSPFKESNDPYLRKLIPFDLNTMDITQITNTTQHYLFNILKYKIL